MSRIPSLPCFSLLALAALVATLAANCGGDSAATPDGAGDTAIHFPSGDARPQPDVPEPLRGDAPAPHDGATPDAAFETLGPNPDGVGDTAEEDDEDIADVGHCLTRTLPAGAFALFPTLSPGQWVPSLAFDGQALWVAWNERGAADDGGFDVFAARLHCDGEVLVPRFRVHVESHGNDSQPRLAVSGNTLMVVWQAPGTPDQNLGLFYRTFRIDGAPRMADERLFRPTGLTEDDEFPHGWMPAVAPLPRQSFVMAAALDAEKAERFQIGLQRLNRHGDPVAEVVTGNPERSLYAHYEPQGTQLYPSVAADAAGNIFVAWTSQDDVLTDGTVKHTRFPAGALAPDPRRAPAALLGTTSDRAAYAAAPGGQAFLAFFEKHETGATSIVLQDGTVFGGNPLSRSYGAVSQFHHSPALAATDDVALLVWLTIRQGPGNDVRAQRFRFQGTHFTDIDREQLLNPAAAASAPSQSPPAVAHVGDGTFLVVWAQGSQPDYRLHGVFLR
jgi:hypothetical protein